MAKTDLASRAKKSAAADHSDRPSSNAILDAFADNARESPFEPVSRQLHASDPFQFRDRKHGAFAMLHRRIEMGGRSNNCLLVLSALIAASTLLGSSGATRAQEAVSLFHVSPGPFHHGGVINLVRADMHAQYGPGSCLRGTFISAAVTALEIPNVRIHPDAEFWFHNATPPNWDGNPWHIARDGTLNVLRGLPTSLREDVLARVGETSDFRVFYKGSQLINVFGYRGCQ